MFVKDELKSPEIKAPYYEDARADFAPYYRNKATVNSAKTEVGEEISKLGGVVTAFHEGKFEEGNKVRYGYQIEFNYSTAHGTIPVAGLPIKHKATTEKVREVRVQALKNVRDWLKTSITSQVFSPGTNPLLPHLLLDDGETTFADYIRQQQSLPRLNASSDILIESE